MAAVVPVEYLYIAIGAAVVAFLFVFNEKNNQRMWNPEASVFIKARKKGIDVLDLVDPGTGHARFVLGEKEEEDDPVYEKSRWGLHADPSYVDGDASPERHPNKLNIQHCSTTMTFPVSPKNVLAQRTILRHRHDRAEFRQLDFLSDRDLLVLLNSPSNNLDHDADIFIEKYQPMAIDYDEEGHKMEIPLTTNDLVDRIKEFKEYCQELNIEGGAFAYHEYFRNSPYAHSSQTTQRINYLFEEIANRKAALMDKIWTYALVAIALLGAVGVVIYVISIAAD